MSNFSEISSDIVNHYESFLQSSESGFKSERVAKQMSGYMKICIEELCHDDSFEGIFNIEKLRALFIKKTANGTWRASSSATYRNTLRDFYSYLEIEGKIHVPPPILENLRVSLKMWSKNNNVLFEVQKYQKRKATVCSVAVKDTVVSSVTAKDTVVSSVPVKDTVVSSLPAKDTVVSSISKDDRAGPSITAKDTVVSSVTAKKTGVSSLRAEDTLVSSLPAEDTLVSTVTTDHTLDLGPDVEMTPFNYMAMVRNNNR